MEPTILPLLALILGAILGGAAGWFFAGRPLADLRARLAAAETAAAERETKIKDMVKELYEQGTQLATMKERAARADELAEQLESARAENVQFRAERAGFAEQKRLLEESRANLLKEFENTGAAVLGKAQETFLRRAEERLGHSEKASEEKLKALLAPVGDRLASYEKQVAELEAKRTDAFGQLTGVIEEMRKGQEDVRREAQRLGNSLTNAPKARGRWGERALQNVLEQCGLAEHTDFHLEQSMDTADGRLRPDAIVRIPGGKVLVIDSKVSLNAYQAAFEADSEEVRDKLLNKHVNDMKGHIQQLASKGYQSQFEEAPDYVVMFVPGEHFVSAALNHQPELWDYAFEKRVLLATPTNLVAIARTVAQVWRQEELAKEAQEIGRLGSELYDRLAKVTADLATLGTHLNRAVGSYNTFKNSFESRVLVSARKMNQKGIEIGKREIEEVEMIDAVASIPKTESLTSDAAGNPQSDAAE